MVTTRRGNPRPTFPLLPGEEAPHAACGVCSRCTSGIGRDRDPAATDCYSDMIDRAIPNDVYRVDILRTGSDGEPRYGVRRPGGEWVQAMGKPQECIRRVDAQRVADERNQAYGLTPKH